MVGGYTLMALRIRALQNGDTDLLPGPAKLAHM